MTGSAKRKALIFLGLVIFIAVILAASLSRLELQPGIPPPGFEDGGAAIAPTKQTPRAFFSVNEMLKTILLLLVAGAILYTIYRMIRSARGKHDRTFIQPIIVITLILGSLIFLLLLLPRTQSALPEELLTPTNTPSPIVTSPLGPVPAPLLWLVGMVVLIGIILLAIWIYTSSRRNTTISLVGLEAEKAWQALLTGLDLKDVIIKCYSQMGLALEQERGIERKDFMTTGEFENLLEAAGIPHAPLHQLTQLFEAVRYGNWQPNDADEQKAIDCLQAIMVHSRAAKKAG
jgi:hypothetical protein